MTKILMMGIMTMRRRLMTATARTLRIGVAFDMKALTKKTKTKVIKILMAIRRLKILPFQWPTFRHSSVLIVAEEVALVTFCRLPLLVHRQRPFLRHEPHQQQRHRTKGLPFRQVYPRRQHRHRVLRVMAAGCIGRQTRQPLRRRQ